MTLRNSCCLVGRRENNSFKLNGSIQWVEKACFSSEWKTIKELGVTRAKHHLHRPIAALSSSPLMQSAKCHHHRPHCYRYRQRLVEPPLPNDELRTTTWRKRGSELQPPVGVLELKTNEPGANDRSELSLERERKRREKKISLAAERSREFYQKPHIYIYTHCLTVLLVLEQSLASDKWNMRDKTLMVYVGG